MILDIFASIGMLLALGMALAWAPPEGALGDLQRILYAHVAISCVGFLALVVGWVGAVLYLVRGRVRLAHLSSASLEIGFTFITMAILSGSLGAKTVGNSWWAWESHLMTMAIVWLACLAYFMLRRAVGNPEGAERLAAVYCVFVFATVPLTSLALLWWRGPYPPAGRLSLQMLATLLASVGAFALFYVALLRHRLRLDRMDLEIASFREQLIGRESE